MGAVNPLFPKGEGSGIYGAWQQAAFMDDADKTFSKQKAQPLSMENALFDLFESREASKIAREKRKERKERNRKTGQNHKEEPQTFRQPEERNEAEKDNRAEQPLEESMILDPIQLAKNMFSDYRQFTKDMISNYRRFIKDGIKDYTKSFTEKIITPNSFQPARKDVVPNSVRLSKKTKVATVAPAVMRHTKNTEAQPRYGTENWKQLCGRIKNTKYHSEASLEDFFVNYLDFIFGWRGHDVGRQVSMQLGHHQMRLDLVLNVESTPSIVIELKNPCTPLNSESILQLVSYMKHLDTEFGILTNAFILQLYYRPRGSRRDPEEVLTIRFDEKDEDGQKLGELLDRESYSEEALRKFCIIQQLARQDYEAIIRSATRGNNGNAHKILKQRRHLIEDNFKQQSRELRRLEEIGEITKKEYNRLKKRLEKETSKAKTTLC